MTESERLKTLQLMYAGVLVDAVRQYGSFGILEEVTEKKRIEQELAARDQVSRLGIRTPEDLFTVLPEIFGCAAWNPDASGPVFRVETRSCLMCALAKRLGAPAPCSIYCINPSRALAAALPVPHSLTVKSTLWEGSSCVFELEPPGAEGSAR